MEGVWPEGEAAVVRVEVFLPVAVGVRFDEAEAALQGVLVFAAVAVGGEAVAWVAPFVWEVSEAEGAASPEWQRRV